MLEDMKYLKNLSTEELIKIVTQIFDFEETGFAFEELQERDDTKATELGLEILLNDKGDEFLQAIVYDFLTIRHLGEALNAIDQRGETLDNYLLGEVIHDLVTDTPDFEVLKKNENLIRRLIKLYEAVPENERGLMRCDYPAFLRMVAEQGVT